MGDCSKEIRGSSTRSARATNKKIYQQEYRRTQHHISVQHNLVHIFTQKAPCASGLNSLSCSDPFMLVAENLMWMACLADGGGCQGAPFIEKDHRKPG